MGGWWERGAQTHIRISGDGMAQIHNTTAVKPWRPYKPHAESAHKSSQLHGEHEPYVPATASGHAARLVDRNSSCTKK